jgi:carbonic anhydrase
VKDDVQMQWKVERGLVVNTGHTIQINLPGHSTTMIGGQNYALKQFHIHTPSEHQVSGLSYPMEVHFVHATSDGKLAVFGVFVEIGAASEEFGKIMPFMPASTASSPTETSPLNLAAMLPRDMSMFRYRGSLTTPPCSEGVLWSVLSSPIEMSTEQVTAFRRLFSANARPVQPMGPRAFEGPAPRLAH